MRTTTMWMRDLEHRAHDDSSASGASRTPSLPGRERREAVSFAGWASGVLSDSPGSFAPGQGFAARAARTKSLRSGCPSNSSGKQQRHQVRVADKVDAEHLVGLSFMPGSAAKDLVIEGDGQATRCVTERAKQAADAAFGGSKEVADDVQSLRLARRRRTASRSSRGSDRPVAEVSASDPRRSPAHQTDSSPNDSLTSPSIPSASEGGARLSADSFRRHGVSGSTSGRCNAAAEGR